jgi:hypothetical protein
MVVSKIRAYRGTKIVSQWHHPLPNSVSVRVYMSYMPLIAIWTFCCSDISNKLLNT